MKNFFNHIFVFFTGGFFNYLGAIVRLPFSKMKFAELLEETQSNNIGMLVTAFADVCIFCLHKIFNNLKWIKIQQ